MKVTITIQAASDTGVFLTIEPGLPKLEELQRLRQGGSVPAYALAAWRALEEKAMEAAADGQPVETGEISETKH